MKKGNILILAAVVTAMIVLAAGALWAAEEPKKGEFYMMNQRTTLTNRAGVPCPESSTDFCGRNFSCNKGDVARGIILNMVDDNGVAKPSGFGLTCASPNELYKTYQTGAIGKNYQGKVYKDTCDAGFFLVGTKFYTDDREQIGGVKAVCRRYWPVEQRESANTFGQGIETVPIVCEDGQFVTGIKVDYWRTQEDGPTETGLYSLRYYCTHMRHYKGLPEDKKDPRDPDRIIKNRK